MLKKITTKNHQFEFRSDGNVINVRTYYNDSNGMVNHMGDIVLTKDEGLLFNEAMIQAANQE